MRTKKNTKKYEVIDLNFELWLFIYIFSQFTMEISKQNYLIGQQIFPTVCYLTCFYHYLMLHMGMDINFHNYLL